MESSRTYAQNIAHRVRSFPCDPLYSEADLGDLAHYLQNPFQRPISRVASHAVPKNLTFIYKYKLSPSNDVGLTKYNAVAEYEKSFLEEKETGSANELLFLTGRPSAEWLNAIGAHYNIDARYFQQHLDFLPSGQRDWHGSPTIPSKSRIALRLCVPSIIFVGSEGRYVDPYGLQKARQDCDRQLRQIFQAFTAGTLAQAGKSIVRRINIHSGDCMVIEQELSICLFKRGDHWTVLIWSDCGEDGAASSVPLPGTNEFANVAHQMEFCPVLMQKPEGGDHPYPVGRTMSCRAQQPLAALAECYGMSLDWRKAAADPLYAIKELFDFQATAAQQYMNLLEKLITDQNVPVGVPGGRQTKLEEILNLNYAQTTITRYAAHYKEIMSFLDKDENPLRAVAGLAPAQPRSHVVDVLHRDFEYLWERAQAMIERCKEGESVIMINKSLEEAKQSSDESKLVVQLTKATNRLTFVFLPLSFLTSFFGMNFRELGSGTLSLRLWLCVALPLLFISILVVEDGNRIKKLLVRLKKNHGI